MKPLHLTAQKMLEMAISIAISMLIFYVMPETRNDDHKVAGWKTGITTVDITPSQSMWMGGYASRSKPSEGVRQRVWAKAIALQDPEGQLGVMVTMDLVNIPKAISDRIRDELESRYKIKRSQIMINVSHTHTGPEVRDEVWDISENEKSKIRGYVTFLEKSIVQLVGQAIDQLESSRLYASNGLTRFQVNRRNNVERELRSYTELKGPNDYAVPVIKIVDLNNRIKGILFGYACHATVLSDYMFSGDYPGYAQSALESMYPEATAMFFQGAGGDQNPLPRREPQLAEQYGLELAAAVYRVLESEMRELSPRLSMSYEEVNIGMVGAPPCGEELEDIIAGNTDHPVYLRQRAKILLDKINNGEELSKDYPYPVQVWSIGEQSVFAFGGELLVGYAIELKRIFGDDIFVFGYSNDVMGYIPTVTVLREGGYEGNRSPYFTNPWESNIEYLIIDQAQKLAKEVGIGN